MNQETLNLEDATLEHFSKLKLCDLEAFILARTIETKNKLPKKRNLDEASRGNQNLILKAYELRGVKSELIEEPDSEENEQNSMHHTNIEVLLTNENVKASTILMNQGWRDAITKIFDPKEKLSCLNEISEETKKKADTLAKVLVNRLHSHRNLRIKGKYNHWILEWSQMSLPMIAAYMIFFDHVKQDITVK